MLNTVKSRFISVKTILRIGIVVVLLCLVVLPVKAQSDQVYDRGSVWGITYVETKPGHFDDYLTDLSNVWKKFLDAQIEDGLILSYKILSVAAVRDSEPNLLLMVEFKNWATFDTPDDYYDKLTAKIMGSLEKAEQSNIDRGELRTIRGGFNAVELKFKK